MTRTKISVIALLTVAVLSVFNLLLDVPHVNLPDISSFDRHVAPVRASLPREGTIGYYTDFIDPSGGRNATREYYLMQYGLAPVVVEQSVNQKLVITSLHNPQNPIPNRNLQLVHDFGSGVQLLRNITK